MITLYPARTTAKKERLRPYMVTRYPAITSDLIYQTKEMDKIIGRKEEIQLLEESLKAKGSGLVAIYGRRRVGKTFLIHTNFQDRLAFELTGMYGASLKEQLQQFSKAMQRATGSALSLKSPENWVEAFHAL